MRAFDFVYRGAYPDYTYGTYEVVYLAVSAANNFVSAIILFLLAYKFTGEFLRFRKIRL